MRFDPAHFRYAVGNFAPRWAFALNRASPQERGLAAAWSLFAGPGLYWVYERATMDFEVLESDTVIATGSRVESLSRFRPGAEITTGIGWWLSGGDAFMGIVLRGSMIAWSSEGVKSLTFDFIGDRTPTTAEIAIFYSHDWFR